MLDVTIRKINFSIKSWIRKKPTIIRLELPRACAPRKYCLVIRNQIWVKSTSNKKYPNKNKTNQQGSVYHI